MAGVIVTGPNVGEAMDPDDLRAVLEALAAGINSVDREQITDLAINEDKLAAAAVIASKLSPGAFLRLAQLRSSAGTPANSELVFDGAAGTYHSARLANATDYVLRNTAFEWRRADGEYEVFTATVTTLAIFFGQAHLDFEATDLSNLYLMALDLGVSSDPTVARVGMSTTQVPTGTVPRWACTHHVLGFRIMAPGDTSRPALGLQANYTGELTTTVQVGTQTFCGALYLPM